MIQLRNKNFIKKLLQPKGKSRISGIKLSKKSNTIHKSVKQAIKVYRIIVLKINAKQ